MVKEFSPGQRRKLRLGAISRVREALVRAGFRVRAQFRPRFRGAPGADLVVSAGGDGTLLAASHYLRPGQILLGVNTDPDRSVGWLCAATARTFPRILSSWLRGRTAPRRLRRLAVEVRRGRVLRRTRALNDVLVTSAHPAMTFRYWLASSAAGSLRREAQRSSGLWIASAPGSTAAIRAAGGRPLAMEAARFQYRVREPYVRPGRPGYRLRGGILGPRGEVTVISRNAGVVYADGPRVQIPFPRGAVLRVRLDPAPVLLIR